MGHEELRKIKTMSHVSNVLATSGIALLTSLGMISASAAPFKVAQSSDINVKGPTVDCKDVKASAPGVGVSVPNVSRLVPNVGKLLRKGVGVPAPDAEAPDVSTPKVSASAPNKSCAEVRSNKSTTPASTNSASEPVNGLW
jgi:hypothetical protein